MKIIGLAKALPGVKMEQIMELLKVECEHVWDLHKAGIIREFYLDTNHHSAVLFFECEDVDEAKKVSSEFPLIKEKLIDFDYIPLGAFAPMETMFAPMETQTA
jgi:muconolactone delta-isomerase